MGRRGVSQKQEALIGKPLTSLGKGSGLRISQTVLSYNERKEFKNAF